MMTNHEHRVGRPTGADSAETLRRLLDAAVECVATRGYTAASIRDIAAAAGVTSATLYHYFSSKEELVEAAARRLFEDTAVRLRAVAEQFPSLPEQLAAHFEETYRVVQDTPHAVPFTGAIDAAADATPRLRALLTETREAETRRLATLVGAARQRGLLAPHVDDLGVVDLISSLTVALARISTLATPARHRAAIEATGALLLGRLFSDPAS